VLAGRSRASGYNWPSAEEAALDIVDRNLSSIGRGMAIAGVWVGWALALRALISPVLIMIESGSAVLL
jgi:hypothetical protein